MSRSLNDLPPDEAAESVGASVRRPLPDELFIDADVFDADVWAWRVGLLQEAIGRLEVVSVLPSKTLGHFHAIVKLDRPVVNAEERIMLELALGSDINRAILGLRDIKDGRPNDSSVFSEFKPIPAPKPMELIEEMPF